MAIVYNTKNWSLLVSDPKSQPLLLQAFEMERVFSNLSDSGCTNCSDDYSQVQWTLTFASVINNLIYDRHCWRHCGNARKWPRPAGHPKERQISFSSRLLDLQPFNSWLASIRNIYAFSREKYNLLSSSEKQCHIHHDNEICRQVSLACFHRQWGWNYNRSSHGNPTWPLPLPLPQTNDQDVCFFLHICHLVDICNHCCCLFIRRNQPKIFLVDLLHDTTFSYDFHVLIYFKGCKCSQIWSEKKKVPTTTVQ